MEILREILRYRKADWDHEAMQSQASMFDNKNEPRSKILWRKLALNLLYMGANKNIIKTYRDKRNDSTLMMRRETIIPTQSFSSTMALSVKRR